MSIQVARVAVVVVASCCLALCVGAEPIQLERDPTSWVRDALSEIQTVKVGMNRGQLSSLFATEGGLSTGLKRTYVYRQCPYIKIDVEFEAVGRPARDAEGRVTLVESERDVITTISRPYLAWQVTD
jgi:hypothetical protein